MFVSFVLLLVLKLIFLAHLLVHLMSLVLHFAADLALASHLVLSLLFLLFLLIDSLVHQFSLLLLSDILAGSVNATNGVNLEGN
jgi:hypothetical protein